MNILFLSTENPYPPDHGHYLRTFNVLKYVAVRHNVYFLSFIRNEEDIQYVEPIRKICRTADVFLIPDNISRFRFGLSILFNLFSPLPYIAQKYYQKDMRQRIKEIIKQHQIDVVHFDMLHMARYRSDLITIPSILTEHNVESLRILSLLRNNKNIFFKSFMYLQYIKLRSFEKRACADFDICAAVSEENREALRKMSPSARFCVIPNGVDTSYFAPDARDVVPDSLVWVGGMGNLYNGEAVDYFLNDIFPLLKKEIPHVKFTVVGKAPTKRLLDLGKTNKNISSVGYVDDVRPYINSAAVYIAPLKSGGGTKLKILNALSMAKPVVTTSVGAEGIEAENGKHLLIANDPEEFAEKTVYLLKNPAVARSLGENGRKLIVDKYDWSIIGQKMIDLYDSLISNKNMFA